MATGTRQTNTAAEGLRKLLGDIADMKLADDADLPFLIQLETMVLQHLKGGADQALADPGGQPGMNGAPMGMGGMAAPPPGMGQPAGTPGLMQGPNLPNVDELRRTLQGALTSHRLGRVADIPSPVAPGAPSPLMPG